MNAAKRIFQLFGLYHKGKIHHFETLQSMLWFNRRIEYPSRTIKSVQSVLFESSRMLRGKEVQSSSLAFYWHSEKVSGLHSALDCSRRDGHTVRAVYFIDLFVETRSQSPCMSPCIVRGTWNHEMTNYHQLQADPFHSSTGMTPYVDCI